MRDSFDNEIECYGIKGMIYLNICSEEGMLGMTPERARNFAMLLLSTIEEVEENG